jgi:benzoyl-CoA-dihydrodiol lyase
MLVLRFDQPEIGTWLFESSGNPELVSKLDEQLIEMYNAGDWLARSIIIYMRFVLRRFDVSARTLVSLIKPDSAFAGSLAEIVLGSDRSYMLNDPGTAGTSQLLLNAFNLSHLEMSHNHTRLSSHFSQDEAGTAKAIHAIKENPQFDAARAELFGLVTYVRDEIDFDDEVRVFLEERASLSPDALSGLEANLRFSGRESMMTKIFGRLSAWQNWIFIRDNAVGEKGALTNYGKKTRASFDYRRC